MTGRTHDQIAAASALGVSVAARLPLEQTATLTLAAVAFARAPDYIEPLARTAHRTWTHYLPAHLLLGALLALAALACVPAEAVGVALAGAAGVTLGCMVHSLADACTDRGCWLWRQRRQVLLPDRLRIRVYRTETRRAWLTGRVTRSQRPSHGERAYYWTARAATLALAGVQVVLLAHDALRPPV